MPEPPDSGGGIGKYLRNPWILGGAAVAGGAYYLWRKKQLSSNNTTSGQYGGPTVGAGAIEPIILQTPGSTSSGSTSGSNNPPQMGIQPVPSNAYGAGPPGGTNNFVGSAINPSSYYALSPAAARAMLTSGKTIYQSGQEAIDWDIAHHIQPTGINPGAYYALSPAAAHNMVYGGKQVYQSGTEAAAWKQAHPNG